MAEPNPSSVPQWYLRNINQALALDEASGNVYLRTGVEGDIIISGNVTIPGFVESHITEVGTSGNLTTPYLPIGGNVNANVSGAVTSLQGTTPWVVIPEQLVLESMPFEWQVARGTIVGATQVNIFAYNPLIPSTPTTVWDGTGDYSFPVTAAQLTIASTSILDTGTAQVRITGLDQNWNLIEETITLNGTGNVTTSNAFLRINQMIMARPAAGQIANVGTITARISGTVYAQINPGIGKTQMGVYSVANGKTLLLHQIGAFSGDATGTSKFMNFQAFITNNVSGESFVLLQTTWQNSYQVTRNTPVAYSERSDIRWRLFTNTGTATGSLIAEATLVDNP